MANAETAIGRYKRVHQLTYKQLAKLLGISHDFARKLGPGLVRTVSPATAERIEKATGGEIRAVELVFPDQQAPKGNRPGRK